VKINMKAAIAAAVVAASVLVQLVAVGPAGATGPAPAAGKCLRDPAHVACVREIDDGKWSQHEQDILDPWADRISALIGNDAGYFDLALDFTHHAVTVLYHGPLPGKLEAMVVTAREHGVGTQHFETGMGEQEWERLADALGDVLDKAKIDWDEITCDSTCGAMQVDGPEISTDRALQAEARKLAAPTLGYVHLDFIPDPGPIVFAAKHGS
jgi:hypothetical protein